MNQPRSRCNRQPASRPTATLRYYTLLNPTSTQKIVPHVDVIHTYNMYMCMYMHAHVHVHVDVIHVHAHVHVHVCYSWRGTAEARAWPGGDPCPTTSYSLRRTISSVTSPKRSAPSVLRRCIMELRDDGGGA